jgi:hypothetical protein
LYGGYLRHGTHIIKVQVYIKISSGQHKVALPGLPEAVHYLYFTVRYSLYMQRIKYVYKRTPTRTRYGFRSGRGSRSFVRSHGSGENGYCGGGGERRTKNRSR